MHETLEMKEDEIAQLRSRLQQATAQKEELQEQKEKAEKSGEWYQLFFQDMLTILIIVLFSFVLCFFPKSI